MVGKPNFNWIILKTNFAGIGYGSSAVVYEAVYKPLKKRVAVKMIDLDMFERNQIDELRVFICTSLLIVNRANLSILKA